MKDIKNNTSNSRKSFLKKALMAGTGATLGTVMAPGLSTLKASDGENGQAPRAGQNGRWEASSCLGCTSWCSVQVYVQDGRATKIRGNPNSKVNGENLCVRGHMALQQVYDPDRVKQPMKRTNPKKGRGEDPGFVPISWDEALDTIADKIMELRRNDEAHKFMLTRGRYTYLRDILYDRLPKIIGSPNNISHSSICAEAEKFGPYFSEGIWAYRQYDVKNARYVICWGADPIATNRQVSHYNNVWGELLARAKVATVEPRLSATAAKSDEWLPVKPGQDGAVAVAMAHVILTKGLWNREFVGDFTDGENRFRLGEEVDENLFSDNYSHGLVKWWNIELKDRTPEWAEERSGVSAEQIERVATEFAEAAPHAICWVGGGPTMQVRGAYNSMATHVLNGLVGSVDNQGGTLASNPEYSRGFPSVDPYLDDIAREGIAKPKIDQRGYLEFPALNGGRSGGGVVTNRAADGILDEDPYDIKMIIAYFNNFAFSNPQIDRWEKAMEKVPFNVHLTTHATEYSMYCDLVLPATHHLFERHGFMKSIGNTYRQLPLNRPVIDRVWDVKTDETEFCWLLAEKLAERGFPNMLEHFKEYRDPETGAEPQNEEEFDLYALKYATRDLWDPAHYRGGDRFDGWEDFYQAGVWNSNPYNYRGRWGNMNTKTRKFEFYSETLKDALAAHAEIHNTTIDGVLESTLYLARGEQAFVPHYEEPFVHGEESEDTFHLVDYKSRLNREGRSQNCTWYYEMKDIDPGNVPNEDVAQFNPKDARRLGLENGDRIRLYSDYGELECTANLWEGVQPGTVVKAYGQGHWATGRHASKEFGKTPRGGNNNQVLPADYDRLSGSSAFYGVVRLRVEKLEGQPA
jgi:anaerobic selenocysteine-containing dehydrogenase